MTRYVAFLRAINVRGHALVKMTDLCAAFQSAGCKNATSFIQSGNVIFDSATTDTTPLFRKIHSKVRALAGGDPQIVYRSVDDLEALARTNPFDGLEGDRLLKLYVVFLAAKPSKRPRLPIEDAKERLEAIGRTGLDVMLVSRRKPSGMYGFPNAFVEQAFGVPATSRNWNTVRKILERARVRGG
jgi:uncharacterized protein (DUF1697 family)